MHQQLIVQSYCEQFLSIEIDAITSFFNKVTGHCKLNQSLVIWSLVRFETNPWWLVRSLCSISWLVQASSSCLGWLVTMQLWATDSNSFCISGAQSTNSWDQNLKVLFLIRSINVISSPQGWGLSTRCKQQTTCEQAQNSVENEITKLTHPIPVSWLSFHPPYNTIIKSLFFSAEAAFFQVRVPENTTITNI